MSKRPLALPSPGGLVGSRCRHSGPHVGRVWVAPTVSVPGLDHTPGGRGRGRKRMIPPGFVFKQQGVVT